MKQFGSHTTALKRLYSLERKLNSNPELKTSYTDHTEYLDLKHMSLINETVNDDFHMPHHAIIKAGSNTTRIRVGEN